MKKFRVILSSISYSLLIMLTISILFIMAIISIVVFETISGSLKIQNDLITTESKDSHFVFKKSSFKNDNTDDKSIMKEYLSDSKTLSNDSLFTFYEDDGERKVIEITDYNSFETYNYQNNSNKQSYSYFDIQFINEGLETLINKSSLEIQNSLNFILTDGNSFTLNENEALALSSLISKTLINAKEYALSKKLKLLSEKYHFTYSYIPSKIYFAFTSGKNENIDKLDTFAYVLFLPTIRDKNRPYSLNLVKGRLPGDKIAEEFKLATSYDWVNNGFDSNLICKNISSIELQNKCYDSLITEFVVSENYAKKNNLKIGDSININTLNGTIVGIGNATNVIYPKISKSYPIPFSKYMGVVWGYETNENDLKVDYEYKGSLTTTFLNDNALESDAYIYGRFLDSVDKNLYNEKINSLENELTQLSTAKGQIIIPRTSDDFPIKTRIEGLQNLSNAINFIKYGLLGVALLFLILIIPLSLRAIIKRSRENLSIFSKKHRRVILVLLNVFFPLLSFSGAIIGGYFLGNDMIKHIVKLLDPMFINNINLFPLSNNTLLMYGLIACVIMGFLLLLSFFFSLSPKLRIKKKIKETNPLLMSLENLETDKSAKKTKKFFINAILVIFSKAFIMILLISIIIPIIFVLILSLESFPNYKNNFVNGKNYKSAIFLNQPIWNSPVTRYTLASANANDKTYASIDIDNLRIGLNSGQATSNLESIFTELLKSTWLKDSYVILSLLEEFDNLNFPDSQILGIDYSYPTIRDMTCSLLLGNKWETMDKENETISSCIKTMLTEKTPSFINEILKKNPSYPFSIGRVAIDNSLEELFTWANSSIKSISNRVLNKEINSKIIGLTLNQKNVKLLDEDNNDLFNDLFSTYLNNIDEGSTSIPVVLNKTIAEKLQAKVGDVLNTNIYRKELINTETNLPIYAVIKDINNNNVLTSGEAIGKTESYPDGEIYKYYYEKKAEGLDELVLGKDNGLIGFGWSMPKESKALFKSKKIIIKNVPNDYNLKIIGITNNYDLSNNLIYTIRNNVNRALNYGDDWFSGIFSNKIDKPNDVFEKQACIANLYGLYTQNSILTDEFENPLSQCFFNVEFVNFALPIIGALGNSLNNVLYVFFGLFGFLILFILLIISSIASINTKRVFKIPFKLYFSKKIANFFVITIHILIFIVTVSVTLGVTYFITNQIAPQLISDLLFSVPIIDNWWYYLLIWGGSLIIIIFSYIILLANYKKIKKK